MKYSIQYILKRQRDACMPFSTNLSLKLVFTPAIITSDHIGVEILSLLPLQMADFWAGMYVISGVHTIPLLAIKHNNYHLHIDN